MVNIIFNILNFIGAIEKLLYRVDSLEKRLRRSEELLYYIISGNNTDKSELTLIRITKLTNLNNEIICYVECLFEYV